MLFAEEKYDGFYEGKPLLTYMICGARRTGSTHLGRLLWETSQLGKPFEYQLPENKQKIMARVPEGVEYWDFLRRTRTTQNGIFAFKEVAPDQYREYRKSNPRPDHVIYVTRRDEVEQSISLTIALQTDAFFSFQERKREPVYDYNTIMENFIHICEIKRMWEEIFLEEGIQPLRLAYEEMNHSAVRQIAEFVGVSLSGRQSEAPFLEKQGNALNQEWARRFRQEMSANGCSAR